MAGINLGSLKLAPVTPKVEKAIESTVQPNPAPKAALTGIKLGGLRLGVASTQQAVAVKSAAPSVPTLAESNTRAPAVDSVDEAGTAPSFQAKLDALDQMIIAGQGISQLSLDTARAYVGAIMTELKQNPELDPLLKDRDVHNVMVFIHSSTSQASNEVAVKKERAVIRADKKINTQFDLGGLGDISIKPKTAIEQAVSGAKSLQAFAGITVDMVPSKLDPTARRK